MPVQARWHQQIDVPVTDEDPFVQHIQTRIEEVGEPIHLTRDEALLNERLIELVNIESTLYTLGVRCAIKDRDDTTCHACPLSATEDESAPLHRLCVTGVQQESVLTELAVAREARNAGA